MRRVLIPLGVLLAALLGVLAWGEWANWRASRRRLGTGGSGAGARGGREAVVALGYRNPGIRANGVNRYRVRAALRSLTPGADSVLVLCGGAVGGPGPEAELMARYAVDERGYRGPLRLDTRSTTTWENVQNAIPLIEDAGTIKIVSNSPHAEKARAYLWVLRPDLAARLVRGADYRPGELIFLKPIAAAIAVAQRRRRGASW